MMYFIYHLIIYNIVNDPQSVQEVEAFWSDVWECQKVRNHNSELKRHEALYKGLKSQAWEAISAEETTTAISKSSSWKSLGRTNKQKQEKNNKQTNKVLLWRKSLDNIHEDLAIEYTNVIGNSEELPTLLTEGNFQSRRTQKIQRTTGLLPVFQPCKKNLTSFITERTHRFLHENHVLPAEQKGCS